MDTSTYSQTEQRKMPNGYKIKNGRKYNKFVIEKQKLEITDFYTKCLPFYVNSCQIIMCKSKLTTRQIQFRNVPVPEIHLLSIHLLQVSS